MQIGYFGKAWGPVLSLPAILAGLLVSASVACAMPVAYDEMTDGDLAEHQTTKTFDLEVGLNSVKGRLSYDWLKGSFDFDSFSFSVGPGAELISVAVAAPFTSMNAEWELRTGSYESGIGALLDSLYPIGRMYHSITGPFAEGVYNLNNSVLGVVVNEAGSLDYEIFLNVAAIAVPEPDTWALLGFGLAGLVAIRRRRRA